MVGSNHREISRSIFWCKSLESESHLRDSQSLGRFVPKVQGEDSAKNVSITCCVGGFAVITAALTATHWTYDTQVSLY